MCVVGRWDQSPLVQMIRQRSFSLIIVSEWPLHLDVKRVGMWTKAQMEAMNDNYKLWQEIGRWYLLQPKKDLH